MTETDALDRRVTALEQQMMDVRISLSRLGTGLETNTTMTAQIAKDTSELVHLLTGLKVLGKLAGAGTAIAGFVALVLFYIRKGP